MKKIEVKIVVDAQDPKTSLSSVGALFLVYENNEVVDTVHSATLADSDFFVAACKTIRKHALHADPYVLQRLAVLELAKIYKPS